MLYIIISSYNSEKTIGNTLNSIISANIPTEYKIIIVDDCSTDNAKNIVKQYKKQYPNIIKLICNKKNKGAGWSRRIGLRYVNKNKNNWVSFIDSDDTILENYYYDFWKYTKDDTLDIISGSMTFFNPLERKDRQWIEVNIKDRYVTENIIEESFADKIYFLNNKLIRANLFKKVKYSKLPFVEDVPTSIRLCLNARAMQLINNKGYIYYQRPDSLIHSADDIKKNIYDALSKIECYKYYVRHFKGEVPERFNLKSIVLKIAIFKVHKIDINEVYKQYPKEIDTIFKFLKSKGY